MFRKFENDLLNWKAEGATMPLMLVGARQTGKTYLLKKFCEGHFVNFIYINLEREKEICDIFSSTLNPEDIIEKIKIIKNIRFDVSDTVLFFDEIQVSERAITSLKYFCESEVEYKIVCAGSLLGVKINRFTSSFPVGKVIIKYLYPMDFEEFLVACGEENLIQEIKKHYDNNEAVIDPIHEKALDLYKKYLIVGGMPAIVKKFLEGDKKISNLDLELQNDIITTYLADMNKYRKLGKYKKC